LRAGFPHLHLRVAMGKNEISFYCENKKCLEIKTQTEEIRE